MHLPHENLRACKTQILGFICLEIFLKDVIDLHTILGKCDKKVTILDEYVVVKLLQYLILLREDQFYVNFELSSQPVTLK